jgi:hypothetical protein
MPDRMKSKIPNPGFFAQPFHKFLAITVPYLTVFHPRLRIELWTHLKRGFEQAPNATLSVHR